MQAKEWPGGGLRLAARLPGEDCGGQVAERAVLADFVVVDPPGFDAALGVLEAGRPVQVEAFMPELTVETLGPTGPTGLPGRMKASSTSCS